MSLSRTLQLKDESATLAAGDLLGKAMVRGATLYLNGSLGAGKTTLCKGIIASFGYSGLVKSPTYTLVEPYVVGPVNIYHFDLYRLGEAEELEYMGIRDYFSAQNICLVEWPEKGFDYLASADIVANIEVRTADRLLHLKACSLPGNEILKALPIWEA